MCSRNFSRDKRDNLLMKSTMRRPSEHRPVACRKNVSPYGSFPMTGNASAPERRKFPVSLRESPKLKIASYLGETDEDAPRAMKKKKKKMMNTEMNAVFIVLSSEVEKGKVLKGKQISKDVVSARDCSNGISRSRELIVAATCTGRGSFYLCGPIFNYILHPSIQWHSESLIWTLILNLSFLVLLNSKVQHDIYKITNNLIKFSL